MIRILVIFFCVTAVGHDLHDDAERDFHPWYSGLATGEMTWGMRRAHPWPVKVLSIGHTNSSYQNYGGGAYFHHGVDIRADAGSTVIAAAGGKVVNIENYVPGSPAYWEVAILDDEGFLWQYHHVDKESIPREIHEALKSGAPIAQGTKIGEVYYWSTVTFGERFHHIHLNVLGRDKSYLSPFAFLEALPDTQAPRIDSIQVKRLDKGYTLLAEVSDLVAHDRFIVPPHEISFELEGRMPVIVWRFDRLPGGESNTAYVNDFFREGTCGNYTCRKFVVDLGFRPGGSFSFPASAGTHRVIVRVRDFAGNGAEKAFEWSVQ